LAFSVSTEPTCLGSKQLKHLSWCKYLFNVCVFSFDWCRHFIIDSL